MEMYREVIAGTGAGNPTGLILRAVGPAGENLRMIEEWESKEDRERFVRTRIAAGRAKLAGGFALPHRPTTTLNSTWQTSCGLDVS